MTKRIKVKIFPDGQIQAEISGFKGKKCTDYISVLEEMLDAETIDSEATPEYYLEESALTTQTETTQLTISTGRV